MRSPYQAYMEKVAEIYPGTLAGAGAGLGAYVAYDAIRNHGIPFVKDPGMPHEYDPVMAAWSSGVGAVGGHVLSKAFGAKGLSPLATQAIDAIKSMKR